MRGLINSFENSKVHFQILWFFLKFLRSQFQTDYKVMVIQPLHEIALDFSNAKKEIYQKMPSAVNQVLSEVLIQNDRFHVEFLIFFRWILLFLFSSKGNCVQCFDSNAIRLALMKHLQGKVVKCGDFFENKSFDNQNMKRVANVLAHVYLNSIEFRLSDANALIKWTLFRSIFMYKFRSYNRPSSLFIDNFHS